jgi:hypothetical protein
VAQLSVEWPRLLLGMLVILNGLISLGNAILSHEMPYSRGMLRAVGRIRLWLRWGVPVLLYAGLVMAWALKLQPFATGAAAIVLLYLVRWMEQKDWSGTIVKTLGVYSPAAVCMMAILLGDTIYQRWGLGTQLMGYDIAAGILATSWTICGVNKLQQSGLKWAGDKNIALLIAERSTIGPPLGDKLRRFVMHRPRTLRIIGAFGLGMELAGLLFCVPDLRIAFAAAVVVFMVLNAILLGFVEHEWALVMVFITMGTA